MTSGNRFLRKPQLLQDEYFLSYYYRFFKANHYGSLAVFDSVIRENSGYAGYGKSLSHPRESKLFSVFEQLTRTPANIIFESTMHQFASVLNLPQNPPQVIRIGENQDYQLLEHEVFRRNCRLLSKVAFCPDCLKENQYYRKYWLLTAVTSCLKHQRLLLDACPACNADLKVFDVVEGKCPACEQTLSETKGISIEDDPYSILSQKVLLHLFGVEKDERIKSLLPNEPSPVLYRVFYAFRLYAQLRPDWEFIHSFPNLGALALDASKTNTWVALNPFLHKLNVTAAKTLLDFPNGMFDYLDAYRNPEQTNNISLGLGTLYIRWFDKEWKSPEYQFMQNAYNDYLVKRLPVVSKSVKRSHRTIENPALLEKFKLISMESAAQLLNVVVQTIRSLINVGDLRTEKIKVGRLQKRFVYQEDVLAIREKWAKMMSAKSAARYLGCSRDVMNHLIDKGILEITHGKISNQARTRYVSMQSIEQLRMGLSSPLKAKPEHGELIQIGEMVKKLFVWKVDIADIIARIMNGKLQGYLIGEVNHFQIQNIYLSTSAIEQIKTELMEISKPDDDWITYTEARKILCTKLRKPVLLSLRDRGIIQHTKKHLNTTLYSRKEIVVLKGQFITAHQAAQILGVHKLTIQKWARQGRLTPIYEAEAPTSKVKYRFLRMDVEAYRRENVITGPELAQKMGISRSCLTDWIKKGKVKPISGPGIDGTARYLFAPPT